MKKVTTIITMLLIVASMTTANAQWFKKKEKVDKYAPKVDTLYRVEVPQKLPVWYVTEYRYNMGVFTAKETLYFDQKNINKEKFNETKGTYDYLVIEKKYKTLNFYYQLLKEKQEQDKLKAEKELKLKEAQQLAADKEIARKIVEANQAKVKADKEFQESLKPKKEANNQN
jgi:hypothetical protein